MRETKISSQYWHLSLYYPTFFYSSSSIQIQIHHHLHHFQGKRSGGGVIFGETNLADMCIKIVPFYPTDLGGVIVLISVISPCILNGKLFVIK